MNEDAVRAIVRDTLSRLDTGHGSRPLDATRLVDLASHPSHYKYALPASDGPCLIEPAVACNHCGYCQSHGH